MHDREGPANAGLFILKLHGYRLGKVQNATDYRTAAIVGGSWSGWNVETLHLSVRATPRTSQPGSSSLLIG